MKTLSHYVSRTVAASTLVVLIAFLGLDLIFRIIDEVENIELDYTFAKVLVYVGLRTFARLYDVMPIVGLIGCLTGLGALANNSELIVMRSAGVSTLRMVWTCLKPALLFMLAAMVIGELVAPKTEQLAISYRALARHQSAVIDVNRGLWLRDGKDFVFASVVQPDGVIYGLNVFHFEDDQSLGSILRAERASYRDSHWQLETVDNTVFANVNGMPEKIVQTRSKLLEWQSQLKPHLLAIASVEPADLKITHLLEYVDYLQQQHLNSTQYEIAFWGKVFYPLVMISLVLVGISFVFGPLRQVSMGYRVFCGVLIGIVFKTLQDMLGPLSIVFGFSPMLAMLAPAAFCALLGLVLIARVR
jgi:lipopolysaccharide export system permease protein